MLPESHLMTVWRGTPFLQQERQFAFTGIQLILSGYIYRHLFEIVY